MEATDSRKAAQFGNNHYQFKADLNKSEFPDLSEAIDNFRGKEQELSLLKFTANVNLEVEW